jgi:hypothetical protein
MVIRTGITCRHGQYPRVARCWSGVDAGRRFLQCADVRRWRKRKARCTGAQKEWCGEDVVLGWCGTPPWTATSDGGRKRTENKSFGTKLAFSRVGGRNWLKAKSWGTKVAILPNMLYHHVHKKCLIKTFKKSNMIPNSNGGHLIMMRSSGIRMNTNREFRQKNNNIVPNKSDAFFVWQCVGSVDMHHAWRQWIFCRWLYWNLYISSRNFCPRSLFSHPQERKKRFFSSSTPQRKWNKAAQRESYLRPRWTRGIGQSFLGPEETSESRSFQT